MKKLLTLFMALFMLSGVGTLYAGNFEGSLLMTIQQDKNPDKPMVMKVTMKNPKVLVEPQTMPQGGMQGMKIIMDTHDSSMVMLMENNGKKTGMRMNLTNKIRKEIEKEESKMKFTVTNETKTIDGYKCKKIIGESDKEKMEMWVTEDLDLNMYDLSRAINGGKSDKESAAKYKDLHGFPLLSTMTDKKTGTVTTVTVKDIRRTELNSNTFSTDGYQMMDMPGMGR